MLNASMTLKSGSPLWRELDHPQVPFSDLSTDLVADVVIVGAGVTGAMTAQSLTAAGFNVVLLDRRGPLQGSTSATTALIQFELDTPLVQMRRTLGTTKASGAWQRSRLAVDTLAAKIQSLNIDCDLRRVQSLYLAGNVLNAKRLAEEGRLRRAVGLHADYLDKKTLLTAHDIDRDAALLSYDNLSLNPLKLAAGFLLKAIAGGARVHAPVTVDAVSHRRGRVIARTDQGFTVEARHLVYATGYEIPKKLRSNRFKLQSTYAIATRPQPENLWPGESLIWEASDPYLYLRTTPDGRGICGGEDVAFKNEKARDALMGAKARRLEKKLKAMFPRLDAKSEFEWTGTFGVTRTSLPTIGALPGMKNGYGIMAFGGNGITFSTIASELVSTLISGGKDPDQDLFAFQRD